MVSWGSGFICEPGFQVNWRRELTPAWYRQTLELARPRRVPQLAQRLGLDLPDALSRDLEALADLFERVLGSVLEAEAHLDHPLFTRVSVRQHLRGVLLQVDADYGVRRRNSLAIFDKVA